MGDLFEPGELDKGGKPDDKDAVLPDEYKGKTPAELVALIQQQKTEQVASNTRFDDLSKQVMELAKDRVPPASGETVTPPAKTDFYTEPEKAAEELFERKIAPMKQAFLNNEEIRQMQEVLQLPFASDFQKEIQQVMASSSPEAKVQPGFAKAAYHYVMGVKREEVKKLEAKKKENEPEFVETRSTGTARRTEEPTLSDAERRVAEGLGMPADKYTDWRDKPDEKVAELLKGKG